MSAFFEDVVLPIAIVFIIFGLPITAFVVFRILAHRERMAMIAAGLPVGATPASVPQPGYVPVGAPSKAASASGYVTEPAQVTLNKGIRLALIGFAITLGLSLASFHWGDGEFSWHPGPWLLFGLVPMFIGVAQVIIGVLSGANIGRLAPTPEPSVPPSAPYAPPPPGRNWTADPFDVSFTSRPPAPQEFHPPASGPES